MLIDLLIEAVKAIIVVVMVLNLAGVLLWVERKGSALIQDRIGANRASITGLGKRMGLPNFGLVNTLIADPLKIFTKEDFVPDGADKFLHALAPFLALFPVIITFAVVPFGDVVRIGSRTITLQAANINAAALYILATIGIGVYGVALGGWSSNNRWALLGGIRATAQMISYEIGLGLAIIAIVMTYGTLDLQAIAARRAEYGSAFCRAGESAISRWLPDPAHRPASRSPSACRSTCPRANPSWWRLLHRVLGRQAGGLHDDGLCRDRAGLGADHDVFLRRMAGAVALSRRLSLSRRRSSLGAAAAGRDPRLVAFMIKMIAVLLSADSRCAGRCRAFATTS